MFNQPQKVEIIERGKEYGNVVLIAAQHFRSIEQLVKTINKTLRRDVGIAGDDRLPALGLDRHGRVHRFDGMINGKIQSLHVSDWIGRIGTHPGSEEEWLPPSRSI